MRERERKKERKRERKREREGSPKQTRIGRKSHEIQTNTLKKIQTGADNIHFSTIHQPTLIALLAARGPQRPLKTNTSPQ